MSSEAPTLEVDGWELVDGEVAARQYPVTFIIPSLEERQSLRIGDLVKVRFLFVDEQGGLPVSESMRVRVRGREGENYVGVLEDSPVMSVTTRFGQDIFFQPRHVIGVTLPRTDPRHPLYAPSALGRFMKRLRAIFRGEWHVFD